MNIRQCKNAILMLYTLYVVESHENERLKVYVENSPENQLMLSHVGISLEQIKKYTNDRNLFCIIELALGEQIADFCLDGELLIMEETYEISSKQEKMIFFKSNHEPYVANITNEQFIYLKRLTKQNLDEMLVTLSSMANAKSDAHFSKAL